MTYLACLDRLDSQIGVTSGFRGDEHGIDICHRENFIVGGGKPFLLRSGRSMVSRP